MVSGSFSWLMRLSRQNGLKPGSAPNPPLSGHRLPRGEPVHQRRAVERLRLVDGSRLNTGEIAVEHGRALMLERRRAIAGFVPARRAVGREARALHGRDDLGAVGPLRGDAAI